MLLGWLHGAASLYALAYSLCEAWGLVRAARRIEPKRRNLYEWASRDPKWSDGPGHIELRIEAAQRAYDWKPGMLLTKDQWGAIRQATSLLKGQQAIQKKRKLSDAKAVKINGRTYPLNELGQMAAMRDNANMAPFELFGYFSRKQTEVEIADLVEKNPIVGDWKDPAWKP